MSKRSLFDIATDIATASTDLFANDEEIEQKLKVLYQELEVKEDGVYWLVDSFNKQIQMADEHIAKVQIEKKKRQNAIKSIKNMVIEAFSSINKLPAKSDFNPIKILEAASVEIIDESKIPQEYWNEVTVKKLNKRAILSALKKGTKIPGADLVKNLYAKGLK
jgi:hypothetical protein